MRWKDSNLTLGERCVAFAENELHNNVKESYPGSYTSARIKEYLSICTRFINGKEVKVGITSGNWCAASVSFSLQQSLLPGEIPTHGYRVGVVEIVSDLQKNGLYFDVSSVRDKTFIPKVGDLIIFDRSTKGKPETAWYRHIGRVYSFSGNEFKCISGNSGGAWKISNHKITQETLLGFGSASFEQASKPILNIPDVSGIDIEDLAPKVDTGYTEPVVFSLFKKLFLGWYV